MTNLETTERGHRISYLTQPVRVSTHLGQGLLVYATDDGFMGVQLDGETRVDEYPASAVVRL